MPSVPPLTNKIFLPRDMNSYLGEMQGLTTFICYSINYSYKVLYAMMIQAYAMYSLWYNNDDDSKLAMKID
jgi:hypothetical protein